MAAQDGSQISTTTRRGFLKWLLSFSIISTLGGILAPVIAYLLPPARQAIGYGGPTVVGAVTNFPTDQGQVVNVNNQPVMIVNTVAGGIRAFSAICTHLGCIVYWDEGKKVIHSPCHDGLFNPVNGNVISGPPPRPLPPYELAIKNGKVYIGKPLGKIYGT